MKKEKPKRIHIIGSVGSGKTTLAKKLSANLHIPFFELDNVVWRRHESGDMRRTELEREEHLNGIVQSEAWIIEGVHNENWVANSFHCAELIIFLDTPYSLRTWRIIKRFLLQKLKLEKSNYKPTINIFFKMFKWNRYFEEVGKPNFFNNYGIYSEKLMIVTNNKAIMNYFEG